MIKWLHKTCLRARNLFKKRPRGTVRLTFSLSILGLLLSASLIGADASYVKLAIQDALVSDTERLAVDVVAFSNTPVNAIDVEINFDGTALEVVSVDRGGSVLTIWTEDPIIEDNRVILRGGTFRRGFLGEHNLATIEFLPRRTGSTEIVLGEVLLLAGDGSGTPVVTAESIEAQAEAFVYDENTDLSSVEIARLSRTLTDIDQNGRIDLVDVSAFMGAWTSRNRVFDFNGDGRMTFRDFSILLADVFTG
jgi:hypothetical protein